MRELRITAARLGVGALVDEMLAAGCTGIDLSELERRQERDVAAARRARAIYEAQHGARMPALRIERARDAAPPVVSGRWTGTHFAMPALRIRRAR